MDISFRVNNDKFNYRVCAIIIATGKILAMHDERSPYFYFRVGELNLEKQQKKLLSVKLRKS